MDAHTRFQTQIVGALPAITHYFEQLGLAAAIDGLVPWEGDVPLGTLVEALIANRLLQPKALFRHPPAPAQALLRRRPRGPGRRGDRLLRADRRAAQRRPARASPGAARR